MLAEAAAVGLQPAAFWDMTPRELFAVFQGSVISARREAQVAMFTAWHSGAFARYNPKKKLPELKRLLEAFNKTDDPTATELRAALVSWHNAMGGNVRVVPKGSIKKVG